MQNANLLPQAGSTARGKVRPLALGVKPKLLEQLREALRVCHYSRRIEHTYHIWVKRFILFHHVRHPAEFRRRVMI